MKVIYCILEGIVNKVLDFLVYVILFIIEDFEMKGSFKEGSFFNK